MYILCIFNLNTIIMLSSFSFQQAISAFLILFGIIDITGSIPIILNLKARGKTIHPMRATLISFALLLVFFYAGELMLQLFDIDIESFAIAGGLVLFIMAIEMLLDIEIFKYKGPSDEATIIPLVFPLVAGPAAFTTLLTLRSTFDSVNILTGLSLNMIYVFFVLSATNVIQRILGKSGIYIVRKFFAIILLAISVEVIISNIYGLTNNC